MSLFGGTINSLEKGLQYASLKNKTIAQNIANVDTPNYKAKDVSFKQVLQDEETKLISAYRTDVRHYDFTITQTKSSITSYENFRYRNDGNGVDMDA
ncbi:Flagellar basal body rod protein FlgB OS=Ureibacillus acetophenoni OX=614649 GN=SAMN05877842_101465 PE=3 SV=1 [Ureibacillus acetophenoni]